MPFVWSAKDPDEEYEYTHDWGPRLLVDLGAGPIDVGDTLVLPDDLDPTKRPTLVPIAGDEGGAIPADIVNIPVTSKLQYWFPKGTGVPGKKSKFIGTVQTTQGRTYQESFVLPIKER